MQVVENQALRLDPNSPGPRALCITRPPEVIGVIHIPLPSSATKRWTSPAPTSRANSIYLVFDSHPRPNHPDGAAVQIFPSQSIGDVANYLMNLFRIDQEIINDPELEWSAQLLGQVSYHVLAPSSVSDTTDEYAINMRILESTRKCAWAEEKLKAAEAETKKLRSKIFDQQQEITRLNSNVQNLRTQDEAQNFRAQRNRPPLPPKESRNIPWMSISNQRGANATPKGKESVSQVPTPSKDERRFLPRFSNETQGRGGNGLNDLHTLRPSTSSPVRTASRPVSELSQWSKAPSRTQLSFAPTSSRPRITSPSINNRSRAAAAAEDARLLADARSLELALSLQKQFDDETIEFSMAESLARSLDQPKFSCEICMEILPDEAIARIDGCGHSCCRDCLRGEIQTKIEGRRYPILCPFCVASADDDDDGQGRRVGIIPAWIVETIGISPELFEIYTDLQLAEHSIMIDCRGCWFTSVSLKHLTLTETTYLQAQVQYFSIARTMTSQRL
ncbi:unnamed protein product [Rhizoctonia solani]|uniref:RING-type domain-containing protein n=1 Tax=Rhizoctonia solani TaxID=456999 RepID=A0A8H3BZ39_9AGAM|nr:unnamed protein product [Rhizoctonia solani]